MGIPAHGLRDEPRRPAEAPRFAAPRAGAPARCVLRSPGAGERAAVGAAAVAVSRPYQRSIAASLGAVCPRFGGSLGPGGRRRHSPARSPLPALRGCSAAPHSPDRRCLCAGTRPRATAKLRALRVWREFPNSGASWDATPSR